VVRGSFGWTDVSGVAVSGIGALGCDCCGRGEVCCEASKGGGATPSGTVEEGIFGGTVLNCVAGCDGCVFGV